MGLSSRPSPKAFDPPPKTSLPESVSARVKRAEDFFVDSLEAWREKGGYEKMTLIGHSLGGYLSAAYTLKYPSRVDRLILISPVGIPPNPSDPSPSPSDPTTDQDQTDAAPAPAVLASEELTQSREETKGKNGAQSKEGKKVKEDEAEQGKKATASRPRLRAAFGWAWEQGFSPFGVLRALGPLAPKLVGTYASRRFEGLGPDDVRDMQYVDSSLPFPLHSPFAHLLLFIINFSS
jgi:cardiolipin-specific phospholipase